MVPHPGDEVLSLFLGQSPLVVAEQLAGIAENQKLHPVAPSAGAAGPGLLLRSSFPLWLGAAPAGTVHDSVPDVRAGLLLRRTTSQMPRLSYPLSQRSRIPVATSTQPPWRATKWRKRNFRWESRTSGNNSGRFVTGDRGHLKL